MLRCTSITSASRVNSSTMFISFNALPSAVWSNWKSNAHRCRGRSARSRLAGTVDSPSRRRLRLRCGTRSPSSRHSRCTRLRFTDQPCSRK